mmetsp:Transcript_47757/g.97617  ORF Transcript_47757/g.97617 Transcript_47757/m.97617 type:complete len:482 (+) Transcript_47757:235-1680(+)
MDKYEIGAKLGSGGFATVWMGRRKADGKVVAIKKIECENFDDANQALTEGKMLLELDHQNVISYYDFFLSQEKGAGSRNKMSVVLVMSYAPDGDLFSKLERAHKEQRQIPEDTIRKWLYQLCQALDYVASKRIIHRDVKLANVLLSGDCLKLADFGIAKVMHGKFAQTIVGGTPCYMAPELLYKEKYDTKSDIWSLGCLIWELSCCSLLSQTKGVLGAQVLKDPSRLKEMWSKMEQLGRSKDLIQCCKRMMAPETADRCSARDVLDSPLFRPRHRDQPDPSAAMQTLALTRAQGETSLGSQPPPRRGGGGEQQQQQQQRESKEREREQLEREQREREQRREHQAPAQRDPQRGQSAGRKLDPRAEAEVDALCGEADRFQQTRDYERAELCFRKALAMDPRHTRSLCNYAYMLHVGKRDFAKAEELYRRALQVEPTRTATLCNYAYLLHSDKRMEEARQIFQRAKASNPEHPWVRKNLTLFS